MSHDANISQGAGHFQLREGLVKGHESYGRANAARESMKTRGSKNRGTRERVSRISSDTNSMVICRRRQPLRHLEGGALGAPQRTR
jgi:hypothetical protein